MAFITPEEADGLGKKAEKSELEIKEEAPDAASETESEERGIERRLAPRHSAQREAHLLFIASPVEVESQRPPHPLIGYTRDISHTGLSLIVTSTHIGDYDLCGVGCLLRIKLSLPSGITEMDTRVVRREWLDEDDPRRGYFIGVQITEISDEARGRYSGYLTMLG